MKCMETVDCWCAECTDREIAAFESISQPKTKTDRPNAGPVDVAWVFEYDLEQKLSQSVRCF